MSSQNLSLSIHKLEKTYDVHRFMKAPLHVKALRGVSLEVRQGETLAIVGESGCGKSTLAKLLMGIEKPTGGEIEIHGLKHSSISSKELSNHIQMIFQDAGSSLNPRKKIKDVIAEPLRIRGGLPEAEIERQVLEVMATVGLRSDLTERFAHMLSGGQRQRVGIARALMTDPRILVCDEPVSALDVSVQAQVLNLLLDLQKERNLSYVFISHDLGVVRFVADRVAVMYLGKFVEIADRESLFSEARHPYSQLLLTSSPGFTGEITAEATVASELPSPLNPPSGCAFRTRCPFAKDRCASEMPELRRVGRSWVACHFAESIPAKKFYL